MKVKTVNETKSTDIKKTSFLRPEDAPHVGSRKSVAVTAREARRHECRAMELGIRQALVRVKAEKRKIRIAARHVTRIDVKTLPVDLESQPGTVVISKEYSPA